MFQLGSAKTNKHQPEWHIVLIACNIKIAAVDGIKKRNRRSVRQKKQHHAWTRKLVIRPSKRPKHHRLNQQGQGLCFEWRIANFRIQL